MRVRALSLSMVFVAILAATVPIPAVAQSTNTYTSIILTDVLDGAPVVDSTFTTDLKVSITNSVTPPKGILGVEIWLTFNENTVGVDDADNNPANGIQVEVKQGFFDGTLAIGANEVFSAATSPAECGGMACVHIAVSHTGGSGPVTNKTGTVATITWAGKAVGPCNFAISPNSILSDPNGGFIPINSISVSSVQVIDAGRIIGTVLRQGSRTDHAGTDVIALTVYESQAAGTLTNANGDFSLAVPVGSTYTVNASYPGYLHAQKTNVYVVGASVGIGTTTLIGGDVKQDNCINILDIVSIISRFGLAGGVEDINGDGVINILDLTIAAGNFGRCGPTAW